MSKIDLSQMFIYPVKSLAGIPLTSSKITHAGLRHDRRWMIVNNRGLFVTQRLYPVLSLLDTKIEHDYVQLSSPDNSKINLPLEIAVGDAATVHVWDDAVDAITASKEHNKWISEYLGIDAKFVYMPNTTIRQVDQDFARTPADRVSFADGFPFLLLSEASLDDLNVRLKNKNESAVTIHRFRPNFVVRGCDAYAEDGWSGFNMGNNHFHSVKPCSRCIMTTINKGQKGIEPLKTLLEYRKQGKKSYFGQNILIDIDRDNSWSLKVGDEITC